MPLPSLPLLVVIAVVGVVRQRQPSTTDQTSITLFADLPKIKELEKVHTKYVAKVPKLPLDEELFAFAEKHRHDGKFGWCFAALVTYGCRVSEVYSLVPTGDGL